MMGPQNSSTENNSNNNTNLDFDYKDKLNNICSPSNDTKVLQKAYGNGINSYLNYHSPNAICLIICCRCSLQYFGETVQKLNERFNLYKTGLKHPSKHGHQ